jgi:hypothetical protein
VSAAILAELSDLFLAESLEADKHGNETEADRLWDIAETLRERSKRAEKKQR